MSRINRAIELLQAGQAIYYDGPHSGHVLTYEQGRIDAGTWADYMNVGMEHGSFDMAGLAEYLRGMVDAGPTRSGHRTPAVIVEAPVNGTDEANVRFNAWQFRQILGRGVHGILLCQAETVDAVRAFVEACRYPHHLQGVDPTIPSPEARLHGAVRPVAAPGTLGIGTRGRGSENTAAPIWGISGNDYMARCEPWPLNPAGELLLGVKAERIIRAGNGTWSPEVHAKWLHDFSSTTMLQNASFSGGGAVFSTQGIDQDRELYNVGAGVTFLTCNCDGKTWSIKGLYDYKWNQSKFSSHQLSVLGSLKF